MNRISPLTYSAFLSVLALGMPIAQAGSSDTQDSSKNTTQYTTQTADQRTMDSSKLKATGAGQRGFLDTTPARGYHSDNLVGKNVTNRRNDETVGEISDIVIDKDGQVVAVLLSVGGLLGMGEHDVAIEWDQIERRLEGDELVLSVDLTEEALDDAPAYIRNKSVRSTAMTGSDRDNQSSAYTADKRIAQSSTKPVTPATNKTVTTPTNKPVTTPTTKPAAQSSTRTAATPATKDMNTGRTTEYVASLPARGFHSDSLVGKKVKSRLTNESVGEISNLVLDNNGQVVAAIISIGGALGIGEHDVAISFDQIERRTEGNESTLWVNLTEKSLQDAPEYSSDPKSITSKR